MKILIGILKCIEQEFDECIQSIKRQTHNDWELFVIENQPNELAHKLLYERFQKSSSNYDLFMKIDADMVLESTVFFEKIDAYFTKNQQLDELQVTVYDHFTNRPIYGQMTYRSHVKWQSTKKNQLFPDMGANSECVHKNDTDFQGDVSHCKNPSVFQSWHYGLHKAVKVLQTDYDTKSYNYQSALVHWDNLMHLEKLSKQLDTPNRFEVAKSGALCAIQKKFSAEHTDYKNEFMLEQFSGYDPIKHPRTWPLLLRIALNLHDSNKRRALGLCLIHLGLFTRTVDLRFLKHGAILFLRNKI